MFLQPYSPSQKSIQGQVVLRNIAGTATRHGVFGDIALRVVNSVDTSARVFTTIDTRRTEQGNRQIMTFQEPLEQSLCETITEGLR